MALTLKQIITQDGDCKGFTLEDNTGVYNATTNPTGYGAPNMLTTDVTAATLTVTQFGADSSTVIDVSSSLPATDGTEFAVTNEDLGYDADTAIPSSVWNFKYDITAEFAITAVNTGSKQFTVSGNRSGILEADDTFTISGSTGNDGTYTVDSITYSAPNTLIVVDEAVADNTADGNIVVTETTNEYNLFFCSLDCCIDNKLLEIDSLDCDCLDEKLAKITKIRTILNAAKYAALCGKPNKAQALITYLNTLCDLQSCSSCD